jgi:hypothetical protein
MLSKIKNHYQKIWVCIIILIWTVFIVLFWKDFENLTILLYVSIFSSAFFGILTLIPKKINHYVYKFKNVFMWATAITALIVGLLTYRTQMIQPITTITASIRIQIEPTVQKRIPSDTEFKGRVCLVKGRKQFDFLDISHIQTWGNEGKITEIWYDCVAPFHSLALGKPKSFIDEYENLSLMSFVVPDSTEVKGGTCIITFNSSSNKTILIPNQLIYFYSIYLEPVN